MSPQYREFPDSWAKDSLTEFADLAFNNIVATFANPSKEYPIANEIDRIFHRIIGGLVNPQGILEAILLMRCHAAYRAACLLAMAGMLPEAFTQLRSCLENALYALHICKNPGYDQIWLNRHNNDDSMRESKQKFKMVDVKRTLEATDKSNYSVASTLYDRTIDFGAHPNERASTSSMIMEDRNGGKKIKQTYLSGGTLQQQHAMKSAAQVGLCSLYIFREIFRERFDVLGLTHEMDKYRNIL